MAKFLGESVPLELLHSMETVLQRYHDQLSSWNRDLTERSEILGAQIAQLDGLSKIWKSTLQLPELSRAAPEIPKRVESLIDLIDQTRQAAESLRARDLALQGHVLETTTRLQAIEPAFEQAHASAVKNLFVQDSPPIWRLGIAQWKAEGQASLIPSASALVFLVTIWAAFAISRFLRFLLEADIYHQWHLARGIPQAISAVVYYAVLLIGFFVSLAVLGVDLSKVTILAGAFTVGVGFGLQTVINNFVCGSGLAWKANRNQLKPRSPCKL
jgi:Mechanosensitive ion channel